MLASWCAFPALRSILSPGGSSDSVRPTVSAAWAEVEHELVYKSDVTVFDETVQRKLAALNANLTLADITFQEIRDYQRRLHGELQQRRRSVWQAVAEATDGPGRQHDFQEALEAETPAVGVSLSRVAESQGEATTGPATAAADPAGTLDDQLLAALKAHNAGSYDLADQIYSQILARGPRAYVRAVILIHRGMVRFVSNRYRDALSDFSDAVEIDPGNWRALYFRGIVYRVLNDLNQAAHDFTRSLSLDPYQVECLLQRAGLYLQIGREDEALADCDAALSLEPEAHSAADLRDRILERKAYQRPQ